MRQKHGYLKVVVGGKAKNDSSEFLFLQISYTKAAETWSTERKKEKAIDWLMRNCEPSQIKDFISRWKKKKKKKRTKLFGRVIVDYEPEGLLSGKCGKLLLEKQASLSSGNAAELRWITKKKEKGQWTEVDEIERKQPTK